jgi:ketosteroid isomerase-like protein
MSHTFTLPTKAEDVIPSLVERFNARNLDAMMELYAPEAVFVANDGRIITDRSEFAALFQRDMNLGVPLKANVRHVFVGGDTAQIVLDWAIHGEDSEGKLVHVHGTASDIMRRAADGVWRYIIDNNQGTAVREPA